MRLYSSIELKGIVLKQKTAIDAVNKLLDMGFKGSTTILSLMPTWHNMLKEDEIKIKTYCLDNGWVKEDNITREEEYYIDDKFWIMYLVSIFKKEDCPWYNTWLYDPGRVPNSSCQFNFSNIKDLWEFATIVGRNETNEFTATVNGESDYVMMVLISCFKGAEEGISWKKIEPYAHCVHLTGGGHTSCSDLLPYYLYKVYGRNGHTPSEIMNITGLESVCEVAKIIPEREYKFLAMDRNIYKAMYHLDSYIRCNIQTFNTFYGFRKFIYKMLDFQNRVDSENITFSNLKSIYIANVEILSWELKDALPKKLKKRKERVSKAFMEHFGRIPKCIIEIVEIGWMNSRYFIEEEKLVTDFDFKTIKEYNKKLPLHEALLASYKLKRDALSLNPEVIRSIINNNPSGKTLEWIYSHKETNENLLCHVIENPDKYDLTQPMENIKHRYQILLDSNYEDLSDIISKYGSIKNTIPVISVEDEHTNTIGKLLDLDDNDQQLEAVGLGYLSHCCQHMGGAGESAMLYSLYHGTFWKAERNGKLLAQAACWVYDHKFVFDNIEFTNDRDCTTIIPILRKWCKQAPYKDIYMGIGHNQLTFDLNVLNPHNAGLSLPVYEGRYVYTDANSVVQLKRGGVVVI